MSQSRLRCGVFEAVAEWDYFFPKYCNIAPLSVRLGGGALAAGWPGCQPDDEPADVCDPDPPRTGGTYILSAEQSLF